MAFPLFVFAHPWFCVCGDPLKSIVILRHFGTERYHCYLQGGALNSTPLSKGAPIYRGEARIEGVMYGSRRGLWVRVSQIGLGWVLLNRACGIEPPRSTADRLAPTLDRGASTIAQHPPTTTTTASKCCCYWLVLKVLLLVLARSQDRGSLSPPATIY